MYCGRFAPTPSGPLHFGSLLSALASYLQARANNGSWHVRIEDLDTPRCPPGTADLILNTLVEFGLSWDGDVVFQSAQTAHYQKALEQLESLRLCYPCGCSRKDISLINAAGSATNVYPGLCRNGLKKEMRAKRIITNNVPVEFDDVIQGRVSQNIEQDVGDFILWRTDGCFAYHLASVVDDAEIGVTEVVRGSDLLDSTPRQIYLQQLLGFATPRYFHIPVAVNSAGEKLSKQTKASPIHSSRASNLLVAALQFLGQTPPPSLQHETAKNILTWAIEAWDVNKVPRLMSSQMRDEKL